jgi:ADP-heptose:LPS heptosyltransferase
VLLKLRVISCARSRTRHFESIPKLLEVRWSLEVTLKRLRTTLRETGYLLLRPALVTMFVRFCRLVGYLPANAGLRGAPRKILVAEPYNSVGDVVLSIPFIEQLHGTWPGAEIHVMVGSTTAEMLRNVPCISRVLEFSPRRTLPRLMQYSEFFRLFRFAKEKMPRDYDLALDPRWDSDGSTYVSRLAMYLSGAPVRGGYSGRVDGITPSLDRFLTACADGGHHEHDSIRKMKLLYRLGMSPDDTIPGDTAGASPALLTLAQLRRKSVDSLLTERGIPEGSKYVVLSPSANTPKRTWPIQHYETIMRHLTAREMFRFVVIGGLRDKALCEQVAAMNPELCVSLAGSTSLLDLIAIMNRAELFIGNDSGPAHLSGLLGRNTVTISVFPLSSAGIEHANSPQRFRPCGSNVRVIQPENTIPPCTLVCNRMMEAHCIRGVKPAMVLRACEELLAKSRGECVRSGNQNLRA